MGQLSEQDAARIAARVDEWADTVAALLAGVEHGKPVYFDFNESSKSPDDAIALPMGLALVFAEACWHGLDKSTWKREARTIIEGAIRRISALAHVAEQEQQRRIVTPDGK